MTTETILGIVVAIVLAAAVLVLVIGALWLLWLAIMTVTILVIKAFDTIGALFSWMATRKTGGKKVSELWIIPLYPLGGYVGYQLGQLFI